MRSFFRRLRRREASPAAPTGPIVRTHPEGVVGRVYGHAPQDESPGASRADPVTTVRARILRTGSDRWEDLGVIASSSPSRPNV